MDATQPVTYTATVGPEPVSPASFSTRKTPISPVTWAVIPTRKGSKGCPGKALRRFQGHSTLLERALEDAVCLTQPGRVILTTDYGLDEIPEAARLFWHRRPAELCQDETPMVDVLSWVAHQRQMEPTDWILLLQPSSYHPQRVRNAQYVMQGHYGMTGIRYPTFWHPYYAVDVTMGLPRRRQGLPVLYRPDGLVYYLQVDELGCIEPFHGPVLPVEGTVNVDTEDDWRELVRTYGHPNDHDHL